MQTSDVLVTVPTRGSIRWETVTALEAARDYDGFPPILYQTGHLSVALTRNLIVERFMARDMPVLAMVDDDIAPPLNFVELLLPHMEEFDMVAIPHAAPHPNDSSIMHFTAYEMGDGGLLPKGLWPGVNAVDAVATGCVMINREVFETLGQHPFRISHDPTAIVVSDDFIFCEDMRRAGFKIGAFWNGQAADHFQTTSLVPLLQHQLESERKPETGVLL